MFCGQGLGVLPGLLGGLLDEGVAIALAEPCDDAGVERAVACGGEDGDLAFVAGAGVVLGHEGFVGGEFLLDAGALVA